MAAKTFRLANAAVSGYQQLLESDQAAATLATGWTVGKTAAANDSEMLVGTERAASTFSTEAGTPKPGVINTGSPNAFRSDQPITGEFANANWSIVVAFRSVTVAYSGTIRARARVFRSVNANGSGATELTGATQVGTTTAAGSTTADTTSTITWAPGAIFTLNNEYLFITIACEIVTASGSNTADALLRSGTSTTGTRIVTSNLTTLDAGTLALALTPSASETQTFQYTDSATEAFALTPSVAELAEFADSTTEVLAFTITASELAEFADATEQYLTLTPSGSDVYTPGSAGTEYTDVGTEYLALTPSAADVAEFVDTDIEYLQFSFLPSLTFPTVANNITDDFNRADGVLGANWDTVPWTGTELAIASNKATTVDRTGYFDGGADWATMVGDFEVAIEIGTALVNTFDYVSLTSTDDPQGRSSAVSLIPGFVQQERTSDSITGVIASTAITSAIGDMIGLRRMGRVVEAWYKPAAGSWQLVGSTYLFGLLKCLSPSIVTRPLMLSPPTILN
jgi:hypothetical protein